MATSYHFPPDLFNLLVDAIPRINRTKKDLLAFFKNVGTPISLLNKYYSLISYDPKQISKKDITRDVLEHLNSKDTDEYLGIRRKLLQRVVDFTAFNTCYENDIDSAKARIYEIKQLVNLKDSVTKQEQFIENERQEKIKAKQQQIQKLNNSKEKYDSITNEFNKLFSITNPQLRGKSLEAVLNDLFTFFKISIRESFCIADEETGRIYEQIDGTIEINTYLTIIEMKWENSPIGAEKIGRFMGRLFSRNSVDGIIISYSSFTSTAQTTVKEWLNQKTVALVDLKDIHNLLLLKKDLPTYFTTLIREVRLNKNPQPTISIENLPDIDFTKYPISSGS
jgi:hypothetical protein